LPFIAIPATPQSGHKLLRILAENDYAIVRHSAIGSEAGISPTTAGFRRCNVPSGGPPPAINPEDHRFNSQS
jgi:hypothetical protein